MSLFRRSPDPTPLAEIESAVIERQELLAVRAINSGNSGFDPKTIRFVAAHEVESELRELALLDEVRKICDQV